MTAVDRRRFLRRTLAALGAGAGAAGAGAVALGSGASAHAASPAPDLQAEDRAVSARELNVRVPFDGPHQSGVLTERPAQATYLAMDSIAPNGAALLEGLQALSQRARQLALGTGTGAAPIDELAPDCGILGDEDAPDSLTVTIAFGSTLFDHRYGLAGHRPHRLRAMPVFAHDTIEPAQAGGDVLVQIAAGQRDTVAHTVRELTREVAGTLVTRWTMNGFTSAQRGPTPHSSTRNLFAFRDGTANPPVGDAALMDELVWVRGGRAGEPAFADGGTYVIVRLIKLHVEFWDRVGLLEQERMIGRERVSGAPLGGSTEFQDPDYPSDPHGRRIPLDAHMRLANPRTAATADQRMIRRSYNYDRGVDEAGDIDCGLIFTAYNQDPERQFVTVQRRLETEPMVDYITPFGGGCFFAPRGCRGPADWVGSGLRA